RRGVTLVATSNVPPHALYEGGLQRQRFLPAIALLERHLEVVHLVGSVDYRLRQLTAAGTYLPADAPGTAARLLALFGQLAPQDAPAGGSIEIAGRAIPGVRGGPAAGAVWPARTAGRPRGRLDRDRRPRDPRGACRPRCRVVRVCGAMR